MANTVKANEHRRVFKDVTTAALFGTADSPAADPLIAGRSKYTTYITRIACTVTTAAAQAITFQTNEGTPRVLGVLAASAAIGEHELFESDEGIPLGDGVDLDVTGSAGVAGSYIVEGYQRPTPNGVMIPSEV